MTGEGSQTVFALCDSAATRRALFRFRYRIYVELMKRRQRYADHDRRSIEEPTDADARNFAVSRDGEVVAAIRANAADDPAMSYYQRLYRIDGLGLRDVGRVQVTTKLMIRPDLRGTTLAARLLAQYGEDAFRRGMHVDTIDCNAPLVPMFERFSYHSYCGWVFHRE